MALLLLAGALWIRVARRGSSLRALLAGLGLVLLALLAVLTMSAVVWVGLVNARPEMGLVEGYVYLAAFIGLTSVGWYLTQRVARSRGSDIGGGLMSTWFILVLLTGSVLPAIGYLFIWPAIAVGVVEIAVARNRGYRAHLASVVAVALTTLIMLVPAVDVFFSFASPRPGNPGSEALAAIVVPVLFAFLAVGIISTSASDPISVQHVSTLAPAE